MRTAVYPGSFDPFTLAHRDVALRAAQLFDRVVIAVFDRPKRQLLFSVEERTALVGATLGQDERFRIVSYSDLTVDLALREGACALIRGVRGVSDFEVEYQLAQVNKVLGPQVETILLAARGEYQHISATLVREMAALGRDPVEFATPAVVAALRERYARG
jgi:pantetheine-phosphate adenylyltransferase